MEADAYNVEPGLEAVVCDIIKKLKRHQIGSLEGDGWELFGFLNNVTWIPEAPSR